MRFQRQMAGVVEAHVGARDIRCQASAPAGRKKGSFLPHTASSGGWCLRKYAWNSGYFWTLEA